MEKKTLGKIVLGLALLGGISYFTIKNIQNYKYDVERTRRIAAWQDYVEYCFLLDRGNTYYYDAAKQLEKKYNLPNHADRSLEIGNIILKHEAKK